ncbi:hypothetical protein [Streptomyces longwoodensis]|uniref:hypothetical protein n=1 Tax=Streptomyces longwoodensis TaxID=68231 RepID=UPI0036F95E8D
MRLRSTEEDAGQGPAPSAPPVKLVDGATGEQLRGVTTLRLGHGHRLAVERERTDFEFYGGSFYQASRELSARLPSLGLTELQYSVWHTLCGTQLKGGIIPMTQKQIAERLQADVKEVGIAIRRFRAWGLLYTPGRGRICLNPMIAFYGNSERQQQALADMMPHDVPPITLPAGHMRPRSKKPRTGPKGVLR